MNIYYFFCFLSAAAIILTLLNSKIGRMQPTIALTAGALLLSLLLILIGNSGWFPLETFAESLVKQIDFDSFLLKGMLGFLLFAGGLNINLPRLTAQKWEITTLALFATLTSTVIIACCFWGLCQLIGLKLDLVYCLLFGALISPTDPIAVLAIVKKLNAPQSISTQIEGESLFNDGFGLVVFATLFSIAFEHEAPTVSGVSLLAIAMAMAIPGGVMVVPEKGIDVREIILVMTYGVVVFSILVQGSTIVPLIKKAQRMEEK